MLYVMSNQYEHAEEMVLKCSFTKPPEFFTENQSMFLASDTEPFWGLI